MKDYYKMLEISTTATQEEIKSQYRLLLHAWHPDKFSTSEQKAHAEEKLKEFNEAYNVIGNPTKRKEYDRQMKNQDQDSHMSESIPKRSKPSHNQEGSKSKSQSDIRNRKKTGSKKKKQNFRSKKVVDPIQIVAIGAVVLVAAWFAWKYIPKSQSAAVAPSSNSTACKPFESIAPAKQYDAPPMSIDKTKKYFATYKMQKGGEFVVQLYPDKAPITVNSFVFLSCKGYFNGVTFHRVLEGFMAQGGDPTGTGMGGPGYEFVNEDSDLTFDKAGVVAMANAGRDTNGSQFFITFGPTPQLNGGYTIFGQVIEGMDVVNGITRRDPQQNPSFQGDVIESITITEE